MTRPEPGVRRWVTADDLARMPWTVRHKVQAARVALLAHLELERPHRDRETPAEYQARQYRAAERAHAGLPLVPAYLAAARRSAIGGNDPDAVRALAGAILAALPVDPDDVIQARRAVLLAAADRNRYIPASTAA